MGTHTRCDQKSVQLLLAQAFCYFLSLRLAANVIFYLIFVQRRSTFSLRRRAGSAYTGPPKLTSCVSGNPFSSPPDCHSLPRRRFATPSGDDICLLFGGGGSRRLTEGGLLYSYFSLSPTPSRLHRDTPPKEGALVCAASMPVRRKSLFVLYPSPSASPTPLPEGEA